MLPCFKALRLTTFPASEEHFEGQGDSMNDNKTGEAMNIKLAPEPRRGNRLKCYKALVNGPMSSQAVALAAGLTKQRASETLSAGRIEGLFVKNEHKNRWAIAPLSTYEHIHPKYNEKATESRRVRKAKRGSYISKMAKKHGKSEDEIVRLALQYYNRNRYRRVNPVQKKQGFWARLFNA